MTLSEFERTRPNLRSSIESWLWLAVIGCRRLEIVREGKPQVGGVACQ